MSRLAAVVLYLELDLSELGRLSDVVFRTSRKGGNRRLACKVPSRGQPDDIVLFLHGGLSRPSPFDHKCSIASFHSSSD